MGRTEGMTIHIDIRVSRGKNTSDYCECAGASIAIVLDENGQMCSASVTENQNSDPRLIESLKRRLPQIARAMLAEGPIDQARTN